VFAGTVPVRDYLTGLFDDNTVFPEEQNGPENLRADNGFVILQ